MKNQRKTEYQGNEVYTDYNAGGWYCSVTDVVNFITDSTDVGYILSVKPMGKQNIRMKKGCDLRSQPLIKYQLNTFAGLLGRFIR